MPKRRNRSLPPGNGGANGIPAAEWKGWEALKRLAEALGNVSEACRRAGVSRHAYYEWKKKAHLVSNSGMGETPRLRKRHPHSTSAALEGEIVKLALENPDWGCDRIAYYLELNRKKVSSPTVQKILIRNRIGRKFQRLKTKG